MPPDDVPEKLRPLLPAAGDSHHAERQKAELARRIAADFIRVGDGAGIAGALSVMLSIATSDKVRARTRANTARDYVRLALRAAELEATADGAGPPPLQPGAAPPTRDLYVAVLADPEGRARLLDALSARLGVPPPVKAVRAGRTEAPALEVAATSAKPKAKRARAKPKASTVNGTASS